MNTYPALPAFILALTALLLKATLLSAIQVVMRLRAKTFLIQEDARLLGVAVASHEHPFVMRCGNVWRNDTENIPVFLATSLGYTLLGGDAATATWLFGAYAVLRYLHTAIYLRGLQPWRAVVFLLGLAICWAIAIKSLLLL